jgi:hypothetical protein
MTLPTVIPSLRADTRGKYFEIRLPPELGIGTMPKRGGASFVTFALFVEAGIIGKDRF